MFKDLLSKSYKNEYIDMLYVVKVVWYEMNSNELILPILLIILRFETKCLSLLLVGV